MAIFNGSAPAVAGEQIDHLQLYPNGGVGMLGNMGVAEAAVRAERWAWLVVTRQGHEVKTYINGRLCAKLDVTVKQPTKDKKKTPEGDNGDKKEGESDGATAKGGKRDKEARLPERLCVDPQHLALFAPPADGNEAGGTAERGLALRYVQLATECWDAEGVRSRMESLRAKDDEAELHDEVRAHAAHHPQRQSPVPRRAASHLRGERTCVTVCDATRHAAYVAGGSSAL